jgi:hypothetical protein
MERAYMPPAEPPPLEHDAWGAPHPKAAVAGPPARTAGFDSIADYRSLNGDDGPCPKCVIRCYAAELPNRVDSRPSPDRARTARLRR